MIFQCSVFSGAWREDNPINKKKIIDHGIEAGRERYLKNFNNLLGTSGSYFFGSKLTWADIMVANAVEFVQKVWCADIAANFPLVLKHQETVHETKGIKEWIAKRPLTKL